MADNLLVAPELVLCNMINRVNTAVGAALTPDVVTFGIPTQSALAKNTDITVTAVPGKGYTGDSVINYDRVHLQQGMADLFVASGAERNMIFPVGEALKISDLIPAINARCGINMVAGDYVDADLPAFEGGIPNEQKDVQITAHADSLIYRGSMTIKIMAEDIELSGVIVNTTMDGLVYAPPA